MDSSRREKLCKLKQNSTDEVHVIRDFRVMDQALSKIFEKHCQYRFEAPRTAPMLASLISSGDARFFCPRPKTH